MLYALAPAADPNPPSTPSVTDWIQVWVNGALALLTLAAIVITLVTLWIARRKDAREKADALAAQARLVVTRAGFSVQDRTANGRMTVTCEIHNNSDKWITLVYAHVGPVETGYTMDLGGSGTAEDLDEFGRPQPRLNPDGGTWFGKEIVEDGTVSMTSLRPTILFLDAAGLVWERVGNGEPKRILDLMDYVRRREVERETYWRKQDQGPGDYFATGQLPESSADPA